MAALTGVAQSTVSYVMSGNRPISQKTRDKVEKAMRELGYVPDAHARAMISNRSHIIGLLTETTETTQGAELFPILRAIRATAKEHGYDLILMSSTCTTEDLADMRRLGKGNLVDAFIMLDIRHHDGRLKSAMKLGLPIVPYGDHEFPFIMLFYSSRLSFSCGGVGKPPFSRAGRAGGLTCGATMARLGPRYGSGRFSLRATSSRVEGDGLAGTGAAPMVSFPVCAPRSFFRFGSQQSRTPAAQRDAPHAVRPSAKVPPDPLR